MEAVKYLFRWALLSFVVHGVWEVAHLPLYTLWDEPNRLRIVLYLLHCLGGDVLIASTIYVIAAWALRDFAWPMHRPWRGGSVIIVLGFVFTGFSEWYNVYQLQAWSYAESMPLVFGIGVSPLLQWIIVSAFMIIVVRYWRR